MDPELLRAIGESHFPVVPLVSLEFWMGLIFLHIPSQIGFRWGFCIASGTGASCRRIRWRLNKSEPEVLAGGWVFVMSSRTVLVASSLCMLL